MRTSSSSPLKVFVPCRFPTVTTWRRVVGFEGLGGRGDQGAVHIDPQRIGAVCERHGDMVPVRIGDRAGDGVAGGEGAKGQLIVRFEIEFFTAALPERAVALAEEMALGPRSPHCAWPRVQS